MNTKHLKTLRSQLNRRYSSFSKKPDSVFFRGVADYTKFVIENPRLFCLIKGMINTQKQIDYEDFNKRDKKFRRELNATGKRVFSIIEKEDIVSKEIDLFRQSYDFIGQMEKKNPVYDPLVEYPPLERYENLFHVLRIVNERKHPSITSQFLSVRKSDNHILTRRIKGCPSYSYIENEIKWLEEKRENSNWGSWDYLLRVYTTIHRKHEYASQLIKNETYYLQRIEFSHWIEEMEVVLGKRKPEDYTYGQHQFERDNYDVHINRIHSYLEERLEEEIDKYESINFGDSNERKAWEKYWDLLQAVWSAFKEQEDNHNLIIQAKRIVIKGRSISTIEAMLERLKANGCFQRLEKLGEEYCLFGIDEECLRLNYESTQTVYKHFAKVYEANRGERPGKFEGRLIECLILANGDVELKIQSDNVKGQVNFGQGRAKIISYLYGCRDDKEWKGYKDFRENGILNGSKYIKKAVAAINDIVAKACDLKINEVIEPRESSNRGAKEFRWKS